ncbi:MAG: HD domain-containing protein [Planctomycetota bacterium]
MGDEPATPEPVGVSMWQRAASFAARMHRGQHRKDGVTPYVAHPFRVSLVVREVFGVSDPVCLAAALLHDVIEDTPADYDDVAEQFGADVAACVAALTKDMRLPENDREPSYDRQLVAADWRAKLVKLADVYDNLCDRLTRLDGRSPTKAIEKIRRAVAIAEPEAENVPAIARAIDALRELVTSHEQQWAEERRRTGD